MKIIPAIDLQAGQCVRLKQGQFDQVTRFATSAIDRAAYFTKSGVTRLHIVDLDGAKLGRMQQLPLILDMMNTGIEVQVGGGIRSLEQAKACIDAGVKQIVIGSIAITNPASTENLIRTLGAEKIILALDIRMENQQPKVATHGWINTSDSCLWDITSYYEHLGIQHFLCTDIAKDGMMNGPNVALYKEAVLRFPKVFWQASGGIRDLNDIKALEDIGITAGIVGMALYQKPVMSGATTIEVLTC